jgi:hypothetical protein
MILPSWMLEKELNMIKKQSRISTKPVYMTSQPRPADPSSFLKPAVFCLSVTVFYRYVFDWLNKPQIFTRLPLTHAG